MYIHITRRKRDHPTLGASLLATWLPRLASGHRQVSIHIFRASLEPNGDRRNTPYALTHVTYTTFSPFAMAYSDIWNSRQTIFYCGLIDATYTNIQKTEIDVQYSIKLCSVLNIARAPHYIHCFRQAFNKSLQIKIVE